MSYQTFPFQGDCFFSCSFEPHGYKGLPSRSWLCDDASKEKENQFPPFQKESTLKKKSISVVHRSFIWVAPFSEGPFFEPPPGMSSMRQMLMTEVLVLGLSLMQVEFKKKFQNHRKEAIRVDRVDVKYKEDNFLDWGSSWSKLRLSNFWEVGGLETAFAFYKYLAYYLAT